MEVTAPSARARRASRLAATAFSALALLAAPAIAEEAAAPKPQADASTQKVLRVATSGDYAPFSFDPAGGKQSFGAAAVPLQNASDATTPASDEIARTGNATGTASNDALEGLDVEIARRFAKDRGYRLEIVRFRWPDLARELAAGSFDVAMSGVTVRPERSIAGRLTVPVAATQAVVLTWMGSGMTSMPELDRPGRRVAVNAGGHLEKVAHQFLRRAEVLPIADNSAVIMTLLDRTADAVVTDNFEEKVWTRSAPDAVRIGTMSDDRKAYLLPAAKSDLAAELDRWLLAREGDGTLADLRKRYIRKSDGSEIDSGDELQPTAEPVAALAAAVRERLALMPFVYEAKKADGKPIEDKSQEAAVLDAAVRTVAEEAAAVGVKAPDAEAVRALFAVLIELGKEAQQRIADAEARKRPGSITRRTAEGNGAESAEPAPEGAGTTTARAPKAPRNTGPDLATELRPAIARIGDKIARILVAMKDRVTARNARMRLEVALSGQGVRGERLDELADAIARVSAGRL